MKQHHFAGIDILRFVAAALVMIFHLAFMSWAPATSAIKGLSHSSFRFEETAPLSSAGWVGVEIFFVISGFVIAYSAKGSAWEFLRSRILRLWPGAWLCAPVTALVLISVGHRPLARVAKQLVTSMFTSPIGPWVEVVYWTLGLEIVFYGLIFALLAFGVKKWMAPVLSILGIASSLYWIIATFFPEMGAAHWLGGGRLLQLSLLKHGCFFAIGGLLWSILNNDGDKRLWIVIAICTGGGLLEIHHLALERALLAGSALLEFVPMVLWLVSLGLLVLCIIRADWFDRHLQTAWTRPLGQMTYPLYLVHSTLGATILGHGAALGLGRWASLVLALLVPVAVSSLIALKLEPALKQALAGVIDSQFFDRPRNMFGRSLAIPRPI